GGPRGGQDLESQRDVAGGRGLACIYGTDPPAQTRREPAWERVDNVSAELAHPIPRHGLVVVVEALRELVVALVQRHEVEVVHAGGVRGRTDGEETRIGDGARRQAASPVGI